jgi:hypothetical protein
MGKVWGRFGEGHFFGWGPSSKEMVLRVLGGRLRGEDVDNYFGPSPRVPGTCTRLCAATTPKSPYIAQVGTVLLQLAPLLAAPALGAAKNAYIYGKTDSK